MIKGMSPYDEVRLNAVEVSLKPKINFEMCRFYANQRCLAKTQNPACTCLYGKQCVLEAQK